jgi:hypothetical protein
LLAFSSASVRCPRDVSILRRAALACCAALLLGLLTWLLLLLVVVSVLLAAVDGVYRATHARKSSPACKRRACCRRYSLDDTTCAD